MLSVISICVLFVAVCAQDWQCPQYTAQVTQGTGNNAANLAEYVDAYREVLGGSSNGNNPGPLDEGHRSVNWDAPIVPFDMPGDFFKNTVTRGISFTTPGQAFKVSNPPSDSESTVEDDRFSSFNPIFPSLFKRFSLDRLFTAVWSNKITAKFSIPAQNTSAVVSGFGAVFTGVKKWNSTFISYYDNSGCLIKKIYVQPKANGLSFAGIKVLERSNVPVGPVIDRVLMSLGDSLISDPYVQGSDVVVLDDLIYGEPQWLSSA